MKKTFLLFALMLILSESIALAVVFTGAMDNRAGLPFVPGFTAHSRAWVTGGDPAAGLRLEWQADNETTPGSWTYRYRLVRNTEKKKGFGFFDIETATDFTAVNIQAKQVLSATNGSGAPLSSGLGSIQISDPVNFNQVHDFSNAAVSENNSLTVLDKFDLSHYSGDPGRVAPGVAGGNASALPSEGPVPHPFYGIRVTFPGSFADLANLGYEASEWEFRIVTDRVPMWGRFFGWGDQTILSPFWYSDVYNNHIDDPERLTLAPVASLTGADPYQGWILVPGPLPAVLSTNPADASPAVPVTEPVTAVFGGVMDPVTISAATFTLVDATNGGTPVTGTVAYDPAANTATFTPDAPLAPGTSYTATIAGASDLAGNALTSKIWSFTTAANDAVSPTVTATLPGNGATFIATTTTISATFSEEIKPNTADPQTGFTLASDAGAVTGKVDFNPATRTAVFTPDAPLANNTLYTATITTGVTDRADNAAVPQSWSFTTIRSETILPIVSATVPAARAANVQVNTPVTATFSEAMDPATINAATFKFTTAGVPVAGTMVYDAATNSVIFTPAAPLAFSTAYRVTITTAVSDPAGNHLPLDNVISFTTAAPDTAPPTVRTTSPADGANNIPTTTVVSAAFSEQIDTTTLGPASLTVTGQSFTTSPSFSVTGTVSLIPGGGLALPSALFTPAGPLPMGSVYTVKVTGVQDLAGNVMADRIFTFTTMPDGNLTTGQGLPVAITDALKALRIAVNLIQATQDDKNHGDVAPLGSDGKPRPDGKIDIADALVILRKVVGLVSW